MKLISQGTAQKLQAEIIRLKTELEDCHLVLVEYKDNAHSRLNDAQILVENEG